MWRCPIGRGGIGLGFGRGRESEKRGGSSCPRISGLDL